MDRKVFYNPPREFQEIPFWSWNDRLNKDELRRQIRLMDEGGWGGFMMHSRNGLETPYLGPEWFECIQESVREAALRGMKAWLYDEDKWPSGFVGGASVAANLEFRSKCLVCKVDNRPNLLAERIATFSAREVEGKIIDIKMNISPMLIAHEDRLIQFYPLTSTPGNPTFNDYTYVDLLNERAVRAFLDSTHELYALHIGEKFGKTIPAIFTDEPCFQFHTYTFGEFGLQTTDLAVPWTCDLPDYFMAQNGYDLLPQLPALFFDNGDYRPVRYDFYRTVTRMFTERYTKQVYQWCESHSLKLAGHFMGEDTLLWQIPWIGSAMQHMAWMHIPGVDKLGRNVNGFDSGMVLTIKQLDSVVCQTGKERALCENYGCSGQDFAHTGRKWIGDWAYVLGINLNNPHLALYSMRGERKRDCPQNLFFQQPWWPENNLVSDYFTRLSYVLSQGKRKVDILVIHPVGSAWTEFRPAASSQVVRLDRKLNDLLLGLMQSQRDFHLGDEQLMATGEPCEAHVAIDQNGPKLVVGQMAYHLVIVPPSFTLSKSTVQLLKEFSSAGGKILALEPLPTLIDGRQIDGNVLPDGAETISFDNLVEKIDYYLPFDIRISGEPPIWAHHRDVDGRQVYFLSNIDPDRGCRTRVQVRGVGRAETWDAQTGVVSDLPVRTNGTITEIELDFAPAGSHLFVIDPSQPSNPVKDEDQPVERMELKLGDTWAVEFDDLNSLVLDRVQIQLDGGPWSAPMHILDAQQAALRSGGGTEFQLRFEFEVDQTLPGSIYLVLEKPDQFRIVVNGEKLENDQVPDWWIDPAFCKVDISHSVRSGQNIILLKGNVTRTTELEGIYITGHFGVTSRWRKFENRLAGQDFDRYTSEFKLKRLSNPIDVIASEAHMLKTDLTALGFPFFAGRIRLSQHVQISEVTPNLSLEFDQLHAALVRLKVNGSAAGIVSWQPHCINISEYALIGDNTIEIELVGTLRNLLGPHHLAGGDPNRTNPEEFRNKALWTDDFILVPFGWNQVRLCW